MRSPSLRVDEKVETICRQYRITRNINVIVLGRRAEQVKEVFRNFGFNVLIDQATENADYIFRVDTEEQGYGRSFGYIIYPAKVYLKNVDSVGVERAYKGTAEFRYFRSHYYGRNSTYFYPADPYGIAVKMAAAEAIGNFIEGAGIPHKEPART